MTAPTPQSPYYPEGFPKSAGTVTPHPGLQGTTTNRRHGYGPGRIEPHDRVVESDARVLLTAALVAIRCQRRKVGGAVVDFEYEDGSHVAVSGDGRRWRIWPVRSGWCMEIRDPSDNRATYADAFGSLEAAQAEACRPTGRRKRWAAAPGRIELHRVSVHARLIRSQSRHTTAHTLHRCSPTTSPCCPAGCTRTQA